MENENRRRSLEQNINLPDRLFSVFVQEEYGVNKGVYNTIDLWFYKNGLDNLLIRRKTIINFLRNVHESMNLEGKKLKFGNGGLSVKLNDFWENNYLNNGSRYILINSDYSHGTGLGKDKSG